MMTPVSAGSGPIYAMRGLFSGDIFVGAKVSRRRHTVSVQRDDGTIIYRQTGDVMKL